ncbi:MAG: Holliday junction branch migration protein RuvA [Lachnospiraceae bacterium]|nr:Holliday junction branch migration protein RuvA [Lachnospiraceae bacterium]MBQ9234454.1 Holliday junction branch migration protein RuvA [Lachnospiraceae bacterium]
MYAYIKGTVEKIDVDSFIIDNNGIGYKILTSTNVTSKLKLHEKLITYTYLNVREDDMTLFGFLSNEEVSVFKLLISVSGIGPKVALAIMSQLTLDELRLAVISEDYKAIAKANGVGPKTAQRAVIELKDKFKLEDIFAGSEISDDLSETPNDDIITEAAMALTSLGYSNVEALRAIKKIDGADKMTVEELLSAALKKLI